MESFGSSGGTASSPSVKPETLLKARAVSRGVAIGKIVCLFGKNRQFYRVELAKSEIDSEVRRFRSAIRLATRQLNSIATGKTRSTAGSIPGIFDAQKMILEDPSLSAKIEAAIADQHINAEWAVKQVTDGYVAKYKAITDDHLRERYIDLEDVSDRIVNALGGGGKSKIHLAKDAVIVAKELKPSTMVELTEHFPRAVITEHGGWTSHTFILAREVNLPAVTGLKKLMRRVDTGDDVIVDGYNGQIILHPTEETLKKYRVAASEFRSITREDIEDWDSSPKTLDGREIIVRANLDIPAVYKQAKRRGARGIGLYRSEFLFNQFKGFPSENEQTDAYRKIAEFAGEDGVKIRTFDLGVEQLYAQSFHKEKNPALGLRGIRLSLTNPNHFRTQIRALLRASFERNIDIVVPMVSGLSEIIATKETVAREKTALELKGISTGSPRIGAMVEVPSAVLMINELVEETDFICLGTNDLVQYLLAVDRDNESVAHWFRTLHPAVIRAVKNVITATAEAGKPLIVCGEMAGSPFYLPLLIGLGATELSMNVNSILRVRKMIAGIAYEEARELVKDIELSKTADEIEHAVHYHIRTKWAHLYPADFFQARQI
jgi:phosphotransferase system enzyme I (PtsI)